MTKEEQINKFKARPLSWSSISSFQWSKEEWYDNYINGNRQPANREMIFGSNIGKKLETDPTYLPQIPRHSKMEHLFSVKFGHIPLTGYADSFCDQTHTKILEFKTGKKAWDQKRVDGHHQLTMYALMNYITNKIDPKHVDIQLIWMPTKENGDFTITFVDDIENHIMVFKTKRTMNDILRFGMEINKTYNEMIKYIEDHE